MNAPVNLPTTTELHGLTPELWTSLTSVKLSAQEAVEAVRRDPQAVGMIRAAIPSLADRCRPCGEKAVIATLAPLLALYGVGDKSQAEWKFFWQVYSEMLAGLPLESVQAGVKAYVASQDSQFFPKPGPLLALCRAAQIPAIIALGRARKAVL
jgi:hypothetical protein